MIKRKLKNDFKPLKLSIENFKGFKNKTNFELSKINLFIGANSSGKSTLKQFFSYYQKDMYTFEEPEDDFYEKHNLFKYLRSRSSTNTTITLGVNNLLFKWEEGKIYRTENNDNSVGYLEEVVVHTDYDVLCKYFPVNDYNPPGPDPLIQLNISKLIELIYSDELKRYDLSNINYDIESITTEDIDKLRYIKDEFIECEVVGNLLTNLHDGVKICIRNYMSTHGYDPISAHGEQWISLEIQRIFGSSIIAKSNIKFIQSKTNVFQMQSRLNQIRDKSIVKAIKSKTLEEFIVDKLGLETRLLNIKDDVGKYYGSRLQVKLKSGWFYLDELSDGMRSFVNLTINLGYEFFRKLMPPYHEYQMIFVEEPEIMLHPDFQIDFINYLIDFHDTKRHVILETHSLHILRTVQLAVAEGRLSTDDVRLFDFSIDNEEGIQVNTLHINKTGLIEGEFKSGFVDLAREMDMKLWRIQHLHNNKN